MAEESRTLVLRLAGPLQSWGGQSQFNRRDTMSEPTKSGIIGLLAAAQGRRRQEPIEDLVALSLGVRVDEPGTALRDYHTVSDLRGRPLLSASVNATGKQKPTSPPKFTHVTQRFYLQDAVFVTAVCGPAPLVRVLRDAVRRPVYPLALGRRSCPPTQPLLVNPVDVPEQPHDAALWTGPPLHVLRQVPWQGSETTWRATRQGVPPRTMVLPVTVDDPNGDDARVDLPVSFDPLRRAVTTRRVQQHWVRVPTPFDGPDTDDAHDPFALLGW